MTNHLFELAGNRKTETVIPKSKKKWYQGKPVVSAAILILIVLGCLCAELIMTKDPTYMDLLNYNKAPDREFLFGTDTMGRDIFSMIWYGGRISILIGGLATVISTFIAVVVGAFSGVAPAWLDELIMRFTEIFLSIPTLLLIILLQAIMGDANILSFQYFIYYRDHKLARYCQSGAHRSKTDPKQRVCHRSKMYGSRILPHFVEAPGTELFFIHYVYGSHECKNCNDL